MIDTTKIQEYTDAYLESYMRALDKTHNPDLAVQTAMGVTMVLRTIDANNQPKQQEENQNNPFAALFGAMIQNAVMNQTNQENNDAGIESDDDEGTE